MLHMYFKFNIMRLYYVKCFHFISFKRCFYLGKWNFCLGCAETASGVEPLAQS